MDVDDETPEQHNRRLYPELMSKLDRFALCYGGGPGVAEAEMIALAALPAPISEVVEQRTLAAYGDRLDGYKRTYRPFPSVDHYAMLVLMNPMAEPEAYCGDEEHRHHNRRRAGRLTHKDRRIESREAKQAMIDRALAKLAKKKRK